MTATPRIFDERSRTKAGDDNSLTLNDAAKIVASWNAISKQQSAYEDFGDDPAPMRRVVAFANRIKQSEQFTATFNGTVREYTEKSGTYLERKYVSEHVDGRQNALVRGNKLEWLRGDNDEDECHILSNARCLTEGVDVPALDAVLFLSPRSSQIDVVQAVGRAMRQAPGTDKKYGYIIIPIAVTPEGDYLKTIRDSKYNATWQVLQALKSHDEDFYDTINQADLKQNKKISVVIFDDTPRPKGRTAGGQTAILCRRADPLAHRRRRGKSARPSTPASWTASPTSTTTAAGPKKSSASIASTKLASASYSRQTIRRSKPRLLPSSAPSNAT